MLNAPALPPYNDRQYTPVGWRRYEDMYQSLCLFVLLKTLIIVYVYGKYRGVLLIFGLYTEIRFWAEFKFDRGEVQLSSV